jgi:hypothetical protein
LLSSTGVPYHRKNVRGRCGIVKATICTFFMRLRKPQKALVRPPNPLAKIKIGALIRTNVNNTLQHFVLQVPHNRARLPGK